MTLNTLLAAVLAAAALPVLAQTPDPTATPGIDKREARQEARIQQGATSGQLTPREAARLEKGQVRIDRMEDRAKADGAVSAKEHGHILHAQNVESRQIRREKHDRQRDLNHDGRIDRR